jgi:hypothetical protein
MTAAGMSQACSIRIAMASGSAHDRQKNHQGNSLDSILYSGPVEQQCFFLTNTHAAGNDSIFGHTL